jgi:hypothetical protein
MIFTDRIDTDILIHAPLPRVWDVLTDFARWPEWNPTIRSLSGELRLGAPLVARMHPRNGRPMTFRPKVVALEPGCSFAWRGRLLLPGLFDGRHSFALTAEGTDTRLHHGETFRGLLVPLLPARQFVADFVALNEALKTRVEGQ